MKKKKLDIPTSHIALAWKESKSSLSTRFALELLLRVRNKMAPKPVDAKSALWFSTSNTCPQRDIKEMC